MKDPAIAVKDFLVAAGVGTFGTTSGWSIYIGNLPDAVDTVVLVNRTGGRDPFPHLAINFPSVQVVVRGAKNGYVAASDKMNAVVEALLGMNTTAAGLDTYRSCNQIGDISYLGQDENTRPMFSANFWFIVLPDVGSGHRVPIT